MSYNVNPLAYKGVVRAQWLDDDRFWYRAVDGSEITYHIVDPAKKTLPFTSNLFAFDQSRLAAALNLIAGDKTKYDLARLNITELSFYDGDKGLRLTIGGAKFDCRLGDRDPAAGPTVCTAVGPAPSPDDAKQPPLALSPDKKLGAFVRDWNLWVRDVATGAETQLTTDGVKDYGYATDNAGWKQSNAAILLWSPDSKKIATFQQDQRKTGEMYLVPVTNGHPTLKAWKYPLVGDENITMIERVVIDVDSRKIVRLKMPIPTSTGRRSAMTLPATETHGRRQSSGVPMVPILPLSPLLREHKQEWLRVADVSTGDVREVMGETVAKFYESGENKVNWHYLPKSNEILWFSERDNRGNLYLYDLTTGKLKNQITHGDGNVTQVLQALTRKTRIIYFLGVASKEQGRDPYFWHLYSIRFDGTGQRLLTRKMPTTRSSFPATAAISGRFLFDPDRASDRDSAWTATASWSWRSGNKTSRKLVAAGWKPLTTITVKGRDGKTDLYGMMFKPTEFDPVKKYPIVNLVYPGPQTCSCGPRSFVACAG